MGDMSRYVPPRGVDGPQPVPTPYGLVWSVLRRDPLKKWTRPEITHVLVDLAAKTSRPMDKVYWKKVTQRGLDWLVARGLVEKNGSQYRLNLEKASLGRTEASFIRIFSEYLEYLFLERKVDSTIHDAGISTVSFVWNQPGPETASISVSAELQQIRRLVRRLLVANPQLIEKLTRVVIEEAGRSDPDHQLRSILVWSKDLQSEIMREINGRFARRIRLRRV